MIYVLFGPGGSGKSYLQAIKVEDELATTRRNIVTNLTLDIPKLCEYMWSKYPHRVIDVVGRIRILTPEETLEFWKYRGPRRWNPETEYDYFDDPGVDGVLFIIDEAGASGFSATGWAAKVGQSTRGEKAMWYLDQQRKFGDDVIASCNGRTPAAIAKPFRDKAHYFIRLKNGYQSQFGMFRGRGKFFAYYTVQEPGPNVEVMKKETWEMDPKGIASCYRTQDGVGVVGSKADIGKRAKGIPILWVFPMFIAAGLMVALIPWLLGKGVQRYISPKKPAGAVAERAAAQIAKLEAQRNAGPAVVAPEKQATRSEELPEELRVKHGDIEKPVRVRGYAARGRTVQVVLSDGRTLTEADEGLQRVDRAGIVWAGRRIFLDTPEHIRAPVAPTQQTGTEPKQDPSPPPSQSLGSWRMDPDGVNRLVDPGSLDSVAQTSVQGSLSSAVAPRPLKR